MEVTVGISNRHVHLTKEDFIFLFGEETVLEEVRPINQPGQFASNCFVTLKTDKDEIEKVRVLGPLRSYTQIEISKTDAYTLGLNPPIRTSGDLEGSEIVTLIGPCGQIVTNGCIIPDRHIHITKEDKEKYGLNDVLTVEIGNEKKSLLYDGL